MTRPLLIFIIITSEKFQCITFEISLLINVIPKLVL